MNAPTSRDANGTPIPVALVPDLPAEGVATALLSPPSALTDVDFWHFRAVRAEAAATLAEARLAHRAAADTKEAAEKANVAWTDYLATVRRDYAMAPTDLINLADGAILPQHAR